MSLPFFAELVLRTDEARREFETDPIVLAAVADGMTAERYKRFLLELYHIVWHFNPICAAAASRISDEERALRYFLYEHMHEESGHEQWVLDDLEAIGVAKEAARRWQPSIPVASLCGYNYWCADRRDPCSALGMMYSLEVIASVYGGPFSSAIRDSLLLQDDRGVSFISSHAAMDTQHMVELKGALDNVVRATARDAIIEAALVNFHHFTKMFQSL